MIAAKVQDALNGQINAVLYSAYLYFAVGSYFDSLQLSGLASWLRQRSDGELEQARQLIRFVNRRKGALELREIPPPQCCYVNPLAAMDELQRHEERLTGLLNDLMNLAVEQKDHATIAFFQESVRRQVDSESAVAGIREKMHALCEGAGGVCLLDHEMTNAQGASDGPFTDRR